MERAVQCYQSALKAQPGFAHTLNNLAVIFTIMGRLDEAHQHCEMAITQSPQSVF